MNHFEIQQRIIQLEKELAELKSQLASDFRVETVRVPESIQPIFEQAQMTVADYFLQLRFSPDKGVIEVGNERYVLVRASSLAYDFFSHLQEMYTDRNAIAAFQSGQDFLFDIGHILGMEDARYFHQKMNLQDPIQKLSAGPVHFAYSGWAFVDILPESRPLPDDAFFLKYHHPYSFEADTWLAKGQRSHDAVCIMNAAYSSGWCEESFGIPLTAVEIACRAKGDDNCTFVMAPPHKIQSYLEQENSYQNRVLPLPPNAPLFFNRKISEDQIKASLKEKEIMLQEIHHRVKNNLQVIHHRVKNNLQVIVSLMGLQIHLLNDPLVIEPIRQTQNRIASIAMIHEMLYSAKDLSQIDYRHYLKQLVPHLIESMYPEPATVVFKLDVDDISFQIDTAIPLGLIINELVVNSLKYGFEGIVEPQVFIKIIALETGEYVMNYSDNGVGMKIEEHLAKRATLGLKLIHNLTKQLNGQLSMWNENGLNFKISFSENKLIYD